MKANRLVRTLLLLVLAGGCGKQPSSRTTTNSDSTSKRPEPSDAVRRSEPFTPAQIDAVLDAQQAEAQQKLFGETKGKAESGDALAQHKTGVRYMMGDGVAKDPAEGVKWFRMAAEQRDPQAQCDLAACYYFGKGVTRDLFEAVKWYRRAAEQGNISAQNSLGICYQKGEGVAKDSVQAAKWYRKAAEKGDAPAQLYLGLCYYYGDGVTKDYVEAHNWFSLSWSQGFTEAAQILTEVRALMTPEQRATAEKFEVDRSVFATFRTEAEKGDTRAQYMLACFYEQGSGVPKDPADAVSWCRKSADNGYAHTQYDLGLRYANGKGVSQDEVEAVKWWQKASDQDHSQAQIRLAACYMKGTGVKQNSVEAAKWYRKAADKGLALAQYNLGVCHAQGDGVTRDSVEAAKWFQKAADLGEASAQFAIGLMCDDGQGVPKSYSQAVRWYRKAAEQGVDAAQCNLGVCYAEGRGVPKDYVEAYRWYDLAVAQGNEHAKKNLPSIEQRMTPEQIAEAQRLARNFKPRNAPVAGASINSDGILDSRPELGGTGFFITEDGFLVTNEHVVRDAAQVRLVTRAGLISARVVKVDAANDLALLKAEGRLAALPVAASRAVKLGSTVATIGFPNIGLQGFAPKLAKGEIASLSGAGDDARYFQISVPVQPGNSGGALVDERGNVVGVVSAKLSPVAALRTSGALPENVNYAVKSSFLLSFLESVPEVSAKLKEPNTKEVKFEDVVKSAEQAAVLVLVY